MASLCHPIRVRVRVSLFMMSRGEAPEGFRVPGLANKVEKTRNLYDQGGAQSEASESRVRESVVGRLNGHLLDWSEVFLCVGVLGGESNPVHLQGVRVEA